MLNRKLEGVMEKIARVTLNQEEVRMSREESVMYLVGWNETEK